jgi:citrate lyase subunit gamma (acyl carrier protein)
MELKEAVAGTLESGDMLVRIGPGEGLQVELQSSVEAQFGRRIRAVIRETLEGLGVENATVRVVDKGALDCTIRARVTAAAVRASGKDVWKD